MSQKYPSLFEQGKNLSKFALDLIKHIKSTDGKNLIVDDDTYNKRMSICEKCEKYDPEQIRCTECGCFLEMKASFMLDSCPLEKWGASTEEWDKAFTEMVSEIDKKEEDSK